MTVKKEIRRTEGNIVWIGTKDYSFRLIQCGKYYGIKIFDRLWSVQIFKMSRDMVNCYKDKTINLFDIEGDWIDKSGIYLTLWTENINEAAIYVGQADNLFNRLQKNHPNVNGWDSWDEVIIITTEMNVWGATDLNYLENQFYNIANNAHRYNIKNTTEPRSGNKNALKGDKSKLDEFIRDIIPILDNIGCHVFVPSNTIIPKVTHEYEQETLETLEVTNKLHKASKIIKKTEISQNEKNMNQNDWIHIGSDKKAYDAYGKSTGNGTEYIIKKGSRICPTLAPSVPQNIRELRNLNKNKVNSEFILTENVFCPSPSAGAKFVTGQNRHNLWAEVTEKRKNENGQLFNDN